MSDSLKTRAIILNSIRWKESSKIISIYSEQLGKIKLIARGAYRHNSPLAGKSESMMLAEIVIMYKESRSLQILKEIEILDSFSAIKNNMDYYPYALAILEIVNQIFEDSQSDPVFFNFIVTMIKSIPEVSDPAYVFLYMLLKLSSYLGFKPNLQKCGSSDFEKCDQTIFLSMEGGNIFCKHCGAMGMNLLRLKKQQFFYLKNLQNQNYRRLKNWKSQLSTTRQLIHLLLNYINYHIDRELRIDALAMLRQ